MLLLRGDLRAGPLAVLCAAEPDAEREVDGRALSDVWAEREPEVSPALHVRAGLMGKFIVHQNDANGLEIKHALERIGATVRGGDWVDFVVGFRGNTYLLEVKTQRGKLSQLQQRLLVEWKGHYRVVRTVEEAWAAVGFLPQTAKGKH